MRTAMPFVAALVVAASVCVVCASAHPLGWQRVGPAESTDVVSFTIGLRWKNEKHLDDAHRGQISKEAARILAKREAASPGFESIKTAIDGWRDLVGPSVEDFAYVSRWLKRAGVHCDKKWDHFSCNDISVAKMSRLLGGFKFGRYYHNSLPEKATRVRILTPAQPAHIVRRLRHMNLRMITVISGLSLYNVDTLLKAKQQTVGVNGAPARLGAGIQWPSPGNGDPVLLNVMAQSPTMAGVIFAPYCADGTAPTNFFGLQCTNASDAPVSGKLGLHNLTHAWVQEMPSLQCTTNAQLGPNPYCEALIMSGLHAWEELGVNLTLTFKSGKSSNTVNMKNFNATQFEPSSIQPNIARFFMEQQAGPQDLHTLYGVPASAQPKKDAWKTSNVTQAVIELSGIAAGKFSMSDLNMYMANHGVTSYSPAMVQKIGLDETEAAGEATLDIEMIMGVAQNTASVFYSQPAGESLNGWIVKWLRALTDPAGKFAHAPPSVWSCSYGGPDVQDKTHLFEAEKYYKLLSASGITFATASGDSGAWGGQISYPASSNYNLAVGATASRGSPTKGGDTDVCTAHHNDMITSSGGFSTTVSAPPHQTGFTPAGSTGRGLPDIAALGSYLNMVQGNQSQPVWGTSASAPISAGLITLANHARAAAGKPTLAFANRFIYEGAPAKAFHDITSGNNCYGRSAGLSLGFKSWTTCYDAVKGWDASTGRGTLDFPSFTAAAVAWTNPNPPPPSPTSPPTPPTMAPVQPPPPPPHHSTPAPVAPTMQPPAPPSGNGTFTQYVCTDSECTSHSCKEHTFNQGECLRNTEDGSLVAQCEGTEIIIFTIYPFSTSCQGLGEPSIQLTNQCVSDDAGQYLKNVCHNKQSKTTVKIEEPVVLPAAARKVHQKLRFHFRAL